MKTNIANLYDALIYSVLTKGEIVQGRNGDEMIELIGQSVKVYEPDMEAFAQLDSPHWRAFENNRLFASQLADCIIAGSDTLPDWALTEYAKRFMDVPEAWQKQIAATYGPKFILSYEHVLSQLRSIGSRRAYAPILLPSDAPIGNEPELSHLEYPCVAGYHFLLRDKGLQLVINQRSQNLVKLWPIDIYVATVLGQHIAKAVGSQLHCITHTFGSLHIYERDIVKLNDEYQQKYLAKSLNKAFNDAAEA